MMRSCCWRRLLALSSLVWAVGCIETGKVDQGRVVAFDGQNGTVTIIRDLSKQRDKPDYSCLPAITYKIPANPVEMGPVPRAGKRMQLDTAGRRITVFDSPTQSFKSIAYTLLEQKENVLKGDPLVAGKEFPVVDSANRTITCYSSRQQVLVTFRLPDEYFELPADTWLAGDEIRVYYKEPGQAMRIMNISQTDIFKK